MQEMQIRSLDRKDPLEKEMTAYYSILAWEIPGAEEPGGLQSMGSQRVGHNLGTKQQWQHLCDHIKIKIQIFPLVSRVALAFSFTPYVVLSLLPCLHSQ